MIKPSLISAMLAATFAQYALAVDLSVMNNCNLIARIATALREPLDPRMCRAANSEFEGRIAARLPPQSCYLNATGVVELEASFSCARSDTVENNSIYCYRLIDVEQIDTYKKGFPQPEGVRTANYLKESVECPEFSQGAGNAAPTLFMDTPFVAVARYEFGFAALLGKDDEAPTGIVKQLFARLDPELGMDRKAVETLVVFQGPPTELPRVSLDTKSADKELILDTDGKDYFDAVAREMERLAPGPFRTDFVIANLTSGYLKTALTMDPARRKNTLVRVSAYFVDKLGEFGLSEVDDEAATNAISDAQQGAWDKIQAGQPFGLRSDEQVEVSFRLFELDDTSCGYDGSISFALLAIAEKRDEPGSYGSAILQFLSFGNCAAEGGRISRKAAASLYEYIKEDMER